MATKLSIIDALGPFFVNEPSTATVNWSKVVFSDLETDGRLPRATRTAIINNFQTYLAKVSQLGYNAISIDDLAHMIELPFYADDTKLLVRDYRALYKEIFALASTYDLDVYVNTDYLFVNKEIDQQLQAGVDPQSLFKDALETAFSTYPEIAGVILRVGENDGKDVSGTLLSRLFMQTPDEANQLLRSVLPLFEQRNKQLLFRTWTVGAYKIGDLIWNEHTYDKVFRDISSDALIVSMKFGDTDFMRHLDLNPLFMHGKQQKIIELQTRREWEGMGVVSSFVGWDYANYLEKLQGSTSIIGAHIWCQTGGWAKREWTNLTYLHNSSFWNELNTEVTIQLLQGRSVDSAIETFCHSRGITQVDAFTELLRLSDIAVKKGLYINELAHKTLYFRRTRIPPLLWLTWDRIHLPPMVTHLHRMFIDGNGKMLSDGDEALAATKTMLQIATKLQLEPAVIESIGFQKDTITIFNGLRRVIANNIGEDGLKKLNDEIIHYKAAYPQHYDIDRVEAVKKRRLHKRLLSPVVRGSSAYRRRDRVFLKTSSLQVRLLRLYLKRSKSHLADQSMGIETLFK